MLADGIIFSSDHWSSLIKGYYQRISVRTQILHPPRVPIEDTHNTLPPCQLACGTRTVGWVLTWPGRKIDQIGSASSVEQGHCTLVAVKRYRDPPRIGGRHNFLLRPSRSSQTKKRQTKAPRHLSSHRDGQRFWGEKKFGKSYDSSNP